MKELSAQEVQLAFALTGRPPRYQERTAEEVFSESEDEGSDFFCESDSSEHIEEEVFYESSTLHWLKGNYFNFVCYHPVKTSYWHPWVFASYMVEARTMVATSLWREGAQTLLAPREGKL